MTADGLAGGDVPTAARAVAAEAVGTALLLVVIVGSGIALADPFGVSLYAHAIVVGAALCALILVLGPVSGAHLNPAVTLAFVLTRRLRAGRAAGYVAAQLVGGATGVVATNAMFSEPAIAIASTVRPGVGLVASEALATAGLVGVILVLVVTGRNGAIAPAVGVWIAAAIVFTPSDAFANPAVALGRVLTDTWTGIHPGSVPGFLAGQLMGALVAVAFVAWLRPSAPVRPPVDDRTPKEAT